MRNGNWKNVTIKIEEGLLEEARVLAASRGTSLSGLFSTLARKALAQDASFRARRSRFRQRLKKGLTLGSGGKARWTRSALHER